MGFIEKGFDRYTIDYIGGKSLQSKKAGAIIDCFLNSGGPIVGYITFFADNTVIPANQYASNKIYLYYEMSRFNDIATFLRYEKHLFLAVNTDSGYGYLGCNQAVPVEPHEMP